MDCEACGHNNLEGARFCANCGATIATRSDEKNPMIGKVVGGRYRVTGIIGEGGMGIVYEAEQQMGSTVRKVAVKTLHAELSRDPSVTARFHRECGTVAQLEHPNTIKVYDFGAMDDGTLYIAMEYLAGESLDKVIEREGALHPERVLHLLRQVGGSLAEAHGQGIIHRDLKPENVILVERAGTKDVVKLLDFGIAARTESADAEREAKLTQQGMVLGTPPYMSPEQFTGKALDTRSDIYSLAVMAYEMVTGQLPFDANTPWEWATEHMTAQPRPFETMPVSAAIPSAMRAAILKALSKDREARFDTVGEFLKALEAGVAGAATGAVGESGTAMMEAAPDFGAAAGPAPTAAMPAQPARAVTAGAVAVPAPPASQQGSGRPMGLIVGLGAVAAALIGGIGYATMGSSGGDEPASAAIEFPTAAPSAEPAPTPEPAAPATEETAPEPDPAPEPDAPPPKLSPVVKSPPAKTPTKAPTPTPPKADPPKADPPKTESPKTDEPKAGGVPAACTACLAKADSGDLSGAAQSYSACTDDAAKRNCQSRARRTAARTAGAAAKSGDCATARQILAAANAMGAGSPNLTAAVNKCK